MGVMNNGCRRELIGEVGLLLTPPSHPHTQLPSLPTPNTQRSDKHAHHKRNNNLHFFLIPCLHRVETDVLVCVGDDWKEHDEPKEIPKHWEYAHHIRRHRYDLTNRNPRERRGGIVCGQSYRGTQDCSAAHTNETILEKWTHFPAIAYANRPNLTLARDQKKVRHAVFRSNG